MHRFRSRFAVVLVVLTCASSAFAQTTDPFAARAAVYVGEKVLDKLIEAGANKVVNAGWNAGFGTPADRVAELDRRLSSYQSLLTQFAADKTAAANAAAEQTKRYESLRASAAEQAGRIETFRKSLSEKTTPDDVRAIVDASLKQLKDRIANLETDVGGLERRADQLDARLKRIDDLFGRIPYVPAAPLLYGRDPATPPKAHPLTLEWLKLLVRSERSRTGLVELRTRYPDTSSKMKQPLADDALILKETAELRDKIRREMDAKFGERQEMLREHLPTSPEMIEHEERFSAVFWLAAVTTPVEGRLGVPPALMGPLASEMMIAFKLSGAEPALVAELYQREIAAELPAKPAYLVERAAFPDATKEREASFRRMAEVAKKADVLLGSDAVLVHARWIQILSDYERLAKEYSPIHPLVVPTAKARRDYATTIRALHARIEAEFREAVAVFTEALDLQRPTHPTMKAYRGGALQPLAAWERLTRLPEQQTDAELQAAADRFLAVSVSARAFAGSTTHVREVNAIAFTPDGKSIVSGSIVYDGDERADSLQVVEIATGKRRIPKIGLTDGIQSLDYGPDGKTMAVVTNKNLLLIDPNAEIMHATIPIEWIGEPRRLVFHPKGNSLFLGGKAMTQHDAKTGKLLATYEGGGTQPIQPFAVADDGEHIAVTHPTMANHYGEIWNLGAVRNTRVYDRPIGPPFVWLSGGKTFVEGWGGVQIRDVTMKEPSKKIDRGFFVYKLAMKPDGRTLVSVGENYVDGKVRGTVQLWDVQTGTRLLALDCPGMIGNGAKLSPDGRTLATIHNWEQANPGLSRANDEWPVNGWTLWNIDLDGLTPKK